MNTQFKCRCLQYVHPSTSPICVTDCDLCTQCKKIQQITEGGLEGLHQVEPSKNFYKIPQKVCSNIAKKQIIHQNACGQGVQYCPAAADLSAVHQGRLNSIKRQVINSGSLKSVQDGGFATNRDNC